MRCNFTTSKKMEMRLRKDGRRGLSQREATRGEQRTNEQREVRVRGMRPSGCARGRYVDVWHCLLLTVFNLSHPCCCRPSVSSLLHQAALFPSLFTSVLMSTQAMMASTTVSSFIFLPSLSIKHYPGGPLWRRVRRRFCSIHPW